MSSGPSKRRSPGADPAWITPIMLADWPVRLVGSEELRYVVGLPVAWDPDPAEHLSLHEIQHVFSGPLPVDRLAITTLPTADPGSDLCGWVDVAVSTSGFPVPALVGDSVAEAPVLLEWQPLGDSETARQRLAADQVMLYQGVYRASGPLARLYVLVARRASRAWTFALSFESACPLGSDERVVTTNDHLRGGAVLGPLQLLDP